MRNEIARRRYPLWLIMQSESKPVHTHNTREVFWKTLNHWLESNKNKSKKHLYWKFKFLVIVWLNNAKGFNQINYLHSIAVYENARKNAVVWMGRNMDYIEATLENESVKAYRGERRMESKERKRKWKNESGVMINYLKYF